MEGTAGDPDDTLGSALAWAARKASTSCSAAARVQAARQLLYHCAWLVDAQRDAVAEISMLKALTGELVNEVTYTCQQFHGGMGYMRESPIERLVRDARVLAIGGGATEVMLEEVAKRIAVP